MISLLSVNLICFFSFCYSYSALKEHWFGVGWQEAKRRFSGGSGTAHQSAERAPGRLRRRRVTVGRRLCSDRRNRLRFAGNCRRAGRDRRVPGQSSDGGQLAVGNRIKHDRSERTTAEHDEAASRPNRLPSASVILTCHLPGPRPYSR